MKTRRILLRVMRNSEATGQPVACLVGAWTAGEYFAVHASARPTLLDEAASAWTVTHRPTGLAIAVADSRDLAVRRARRLAAVQGVPWASADPYFISNLPQAKRAAVRIAAGLRPMYTPAERKTR